MSSQSPFDLVLLGAGLANGLVAAAALHHCPSLRIAVVDRKSLLSYPQTWCFHDQDVQKASGAWDWLSPFVSKTWAGYDVRFSDYERHFSSRYHCIAGEQFGATLASTLAVPNVQLFLDSHAEANATGVKLSNGGHIESSVVIDGRGSTAASSGCGFQKFVGWEVEVEAETSMPLPTVPVLMDATVEQLDGYRFVYLLPLGGERLLVEDTYFSTNDVLDEARLESRLRDYLQMKGWTVRRLLRTEKGVLPMPWTDQGSSLAASEESVFRVGYRGGWFQPATGYSVPMAVAVAQAVGIAMKSSLNNSLEPRKLVADALAPLRKLYGERQGFYRLLNRLAFKGVSDSDRHAVFSRFYKLPPSLVGRFYAGQSTWWDRIRILGGRPPVPLSRFQFGRLREELS
jgi:lycopene beta-cyclase